MEFRAVLFALRGSSWLPRARFPTFQSALPLVDGRRRISEAPPKSDVSSKSQVSPGVHHGGDFASRTNYNDPSAGRGAEEQIVHETQTVPPFHKAAVDVSGGTSNYVVVFSENLLSFWHKNGYPDGLARSYL